MIYTETRLKGAFIIEMEPFRDERGYFARAFCKEDFARNGLCAEYVQHNTSYNVKKGTVRGMHYQLPPYEEIKVVQCVRGAILDVIVDMRKDSETYLQWVSAELTESNGKMLYVPKGFVHGYQTLSDNSAVFYLVSEFYHKDYESGVRWDDEALNIAWPIKENITVSEKDKSYKNISKENNNAEI